MFIWTISDVFLAVWLLLVLGLFAWVGVMKLQEKWRKWRRGP